MAWEPLTEACWDLVPWLRDQTRAPTLEAWSVSHQGSSWTCLLTNMWTRLVMHPVVKWLQPKGYMYVWIWLDTDQFFQNTVCTTLQFCQWCKKVFFFLYILFSRPNLHIIKFRCSECAIQWFLSNLQLCRHHQYPLLEHSLHPSEVPSCLFAVSSFS